MFLIQLSKYAKYFLVLLLFPLTETSALGQLSEPQVCPASAEYIAQVEAGHAFQMPTQDFSCIGDGPSILPQLKLFQLVDIRAGEINQPELPDSWKMTVAQLKNKHFLRKKPLLLVGSNFSRAQSSIDCATLKNAGFEKVKFLAGGYETWSLIAQKKPHKVTQSPLNTVAAQAVLFEYFNSKVILVAADNLVADKLNGLGLRDHYLVPAFTSSYISNIATTNSGGGFYPIVLINDSGTTIAHQKNLLPNVYFLDGGIDSLIEQAEKNRLTNIARNGSIGKFACENP